MAKSWAIVIGINQYDNLKALDYAKRDAEAMRDFFRNDASFQQVYCFTDDSPPIPTDSGRALRSQPTFVTLLRFLRTRFEKPFLEPGDNLWFFFAGHGRCHRDRDYLMPIDADPGDIERTTIPVATVSERLRRSGADNVILLLDACRNEGGRDGLGIGSETQQGVITLFACKPQEHSYELDDLRQGAFTHALLEALRIRGAGNCATVERLYQHLRYRVPPLVEQVHKQPQTPYAVVEPATKLHLILLPREATDADVQTLKNDALQAEVEDRLDDADYLWVRVLAVRAVDRQALDGIKRIARKLAGLSSSPPSPSLQLPTAPSPTPRDTSTPTTDTGSKSIPLQRRARLLKKLQEQRSLLHKKLQSLQREHAVAKNATVIRRLREQIEQVEADIENGARVDQFAELYPENIWLAIADTDRQAAAQAEQYPYSHDMARTRAYLNTLCLGCLKRELPESLDRPHDQIRPTANDLAKRWEFVTGFSVTIGDVHLVIIPTLSLDELRVPREWVDSHSWAAPYYVACQVDLEDNWLRIAGYTTHAEVKAGEYDPVDHTYSLPTSNLDNNLHTIWHLRNYYPDPQPQIVPLPELSDQAAESLIRHYSQYVLYSPHLLSVPEAGDRWLSLISNPTHLDQLYAQRQVLTPTKLETPTNERDAIVATYQICLITTPTNIFPGSELQVSIQMSSASDHEQPNAYVLEIPQVESVGNELNIFLTAPGFRVEDDDAASLPLDVNTQRTSQTANFCLTALCPGTAKITAELYRGDTFETTLETTIQVVELAGLAAFDQPINLSPRPVPQPDLTLRIQTVWNESLSLCTFRYHLDSFHPRLPFASEMQQQSEALTAGWLAQTRSLLQSTLDESANSLPEDFRARLTSLGQYLCQHLLPLELQTTFRSVMRFNQPFTLLILADQDAGLPWELLHNGQSFWGERFIIGRWSWELEQTRPYEFAIGAVNLAHYAEVEQPEPWASLLEPVDAPPPMLLSDGVLADLRTVEAMRGLHLLRWGKSVAEADRQDAPVPFDQASTESLEQELQPAKLSLRRNRPLVTLGYVSAGLPELTALEQTWAPTFTRGGCSAFVGPLWAVSPAVEAAFVSNFYQRLWAGDSLGVAFQAGRRAARSLVPDSLDWLAYTLFGDPMARPYRPSQGKGYAIVEPIGQDIADPIAPGASVRFRVSLRRSPPVWYNNRLMDVAEDLAFNDLQVYIIASGLPVAPADSIGMQQTPTGDYLGWFTLTVPSTFEDRSALVQVHFEDGGDPIHSLRFALTVDNQGGEQP